MVSGTPVGLLNVYNNLADLANRYLQIQPTTKVGYQLMILYRGSVVAGGGVMTVNYGGATTWEPQAIGDFLMLTSDGSGWVKTLQTEGGVIGDTSGLTYSGTWNAALNSPALVNPPAASTVGDYYVVSVSGTQFGIDWVTGDWIVSNGSAWEKVDNTDLVTSAFGRTGAVVAADGDYTATQITNTPLGSISAVNIQDAITELDTEKLSTSLADSNIFVGNAGNLAAPVLVSNDATMANTGALTIANSAITVAKCSRFVTAEATGEITQAQLLDLFNTPVEVIAAPGAGLYVVIEEMEILHSYSTAVYINGGILQVEYGDGTDIMSFPATVVTGGASASFFGTPGAYQRDAAAGTGGIDITGAINQNVRLTNIVAVFLNGDAANVLRYRIRYHVATAQT
jgi:hypothetical protein